MRPISVIKRTADDSCLNFVVFSLDCNFRLATLWVTYFFSQIFPCDGTEFRGHKTELGMCYASESKPRSKLCHISRSSGV